ncbi:hypothetical protein SALBM311S_10324 [Streptomyces alboniger]
MLAADRPWYSGCWLTLVAMTTSERFPRALTHLPMMVSDSPPELPSTHAEYESAVSTKLPPAAVYASRTAKEAASSAVQPKTLPPRESGKTSRSEVPSYAKRSHASLQHP